MARQSLAQTQTPTKIVGFLLALCAPQAIPTRGAAKSSSAALCPCRQLRWYISSSHLSFVLFSVLVFFHIVHHVVHHVDLRESLEVVQKSKGWIPGMEYCEKYCGHPFKNSQCSEYQFLRRCMRQGFLKCNARLAV